jgi:aromatic ring hydroxylase
MKTAPEYIESIRKQKKELFVLGEKVADPAEHPILRLIENITLGASAVSYRTESMHGAGSPEAQVIMIERLSDLEAKKALARSLAGIHLLEESKVEAI